MSFEEIMQHRASQIRTDRLTTLVAAMLTGETAPGDDLIAQVLMLARVILKKIEEPACTTP
jgi:hypothetical protein